MRHSSKAGAKRKPAVSTRDEPSGSGDEARNGGPDEAAAYIAETAAELAALASRHKLDLLVYLLGMTQLEAEARLRRRRRLS